ncbi:hypothetical protein G647_04836 [Cladophialophora carrionii CBS 160.54]|uniref:Cohesin loading factor n=1 Tax=Cladophialophora carrionii CBS 160.54 TaxID=1279043 RepID=V9D860_9EURO|nr:uncharacterized protein G647_04836 [Cladophialophora carrionii CBS 160.54]ETI23040.1 hypothetical protein G647_04836 [Cladophialophora carrionii CBS 160.54]
MDHNYPYNNANWNGGFTYQSNGNYSQPGYAVNPYPQEPSNPNSQPYHPSSYPQSVQQNYPQYYNNQAQHYQFQFQQPSHHFYQSPPQPQPILPPVLPQSDKEVIVPRNPLHSAPPKQQFQQPQQPQQPQQSQQLRASYQAQYQAQGEVPSSPYQWTPQQKQQQQQQQQQYHHVSQSPQDHMRQAEQPRRVIEVPKPTILQDKLVNRSSHQTSTSATATPQRSPQQSRNGAFQSVEVKVKSPQIASRQPPPVPAMEFDEPEPDYPTLLCVLADDYLDEARKQPALTERYYTLISKALGCLESVLANFKLPPLQEAQISLRYSRILYDETENHDEAETALTKSIELCERHKFVDLKYEMQLLLSKVLYESKPKAALRDIQRMIEDIEAYRHTVWLYIFRFQHAIFSLASSAPGEFHSAIVQLEKIAGLAKQNSDAGVLAFAATLEALLHLSSPSHEAVTATQNALAKARAMQLNADVESNPQMTILLEFIDLACSVRESNIAQSNAKRKGMVEVLDQIAKDGNWRADGSIYIPLSKQTVAGIDLQAHKHVIERNGKYYIVFSWLGMEEVEALAYLFSADSSAYKNGIDGGKAEIFTTEGLSGVRALAKPSLTAGYRQSERVHAFQKLLEAEFLLLLSFLQCSKGQYNAANKSLGEVSTISEAIGDAFPLNMRYAMLYLKGVILQGTGDLVAALQVYQSPLFNLTPQQSSSSAVSSVSNRKTSSWFPDSDVTRNFSILAAMNQAFIIQAPNHPQHNRLSSMIKSLDGAVQTCGNKYIQAHFSLLVAVLSGTTLTVKQYLKSAMEAGKAIGSAQTTALALIYMQEKLFKGVVDEQALKCAKAASQQTRRWGSPMWMHVTAGLEAQALDINGYENEARRRKQEGEAGWETLPEAIKSASAVGSGMAVGS